MTCWGINVAQSKWNTLGHAIFSVLIKRTHVQKHTSFSSLSVSMYKIVDCTYNENQWPH